MKRTLLAAAATLLLVATTGCHHNVCKDGCGPNGHGGLAGGRHGHHGHSVHHHGAGSPDHVPNVSHSEFRYEGPAGPPTAAYANPYYTVRAPRDFFMANPPSLGY